MTTGGEEQISTEIAGGLVAEAVRRGILARDRAAIVARLESFADGILPRGAGVFSAAFSSNSPRSAPADPHGFDALRALGDAFWHGRTGGKEERRQKGSFYTPPPVIDQILGLVQNDLFPGRKTVCDPAMGCGFFFLRLIETLHEKKVPSAKIRRWAASSLFGVDTDAQAVFVAKALLWLALSEGRREFLPDTAHFAVGDSLLGPAFGQTPDDHPAAGLDWNAAFPAVAKDGGFDVVLGNPPYEVLTNFTRRPERKTLADKIRRCGFYREALSGQLNLYRCFIERGLDLLKPGGALSYVVPLSLARDGAAAALRGRLLERENAASWFLYGEKERLFAGGGVTQSACVFRAVRGGGAVKNVSIAVGGRSGKIPFAELRAQGGGGDNGGAAALPGLDARGLKLWRWLYKNCPGRLGDVAEARVGEVDQTVYRACMTERNTGVLLARGAHLSAFRLDVAAREEKERFLDLPRFLEMKGGGAEAVRARAGESRVVQLGIRNMQSRPRLVAAVAPAGVYAGNSLNVYRVFPGVDAGFVAGMLNSSWLDWLFRATSGNNNINLREMLALPFPSRADAAAAKAVAECYRECERAAARGEELAAARTALDAAAGRCCGAPENLDAAALEEMLL